MSRRLALSIFVVLLLGSVPFLRYVTVEADDIVSLLPSGDKHAEDYQRYLAHFPFDSGAVIVATGPALCTSAAWDEHIALARALEQTSGIDRVIALTTVPYVMNRSGSLMTLPFVKSEAVLGPPLCRRALDYTPYQGLLVNEDATALAFHVLLKRSADAIATNHELQAVVAAHRPLFQRGFCEAPAGVVPCGGDLTLGGDLPLRAEVSRLVDGSKPFMALVIVIVFFVAWAQSRSLLTGALAAVTGLLSVVFTFALMGMLGIPQNAFNVFTSFLLIPNGAMYAIHAHGYLRRSQEFSFGWLPRGAARPYAFATLTTALGFIATGLSVSPAIKQLGFLGAFGVAMALVVTFTLTFPLLSFAVRRREAIVVTAPAPTRLMSATQLYVSLVAMTVVGAVGNYMLTVNYSPIDYLNESNPVRIAFEQQVHLFGVYTMPMMVTTDHVDAAIDPNLLGTVHTFVEEQKKAVAHLQAGDLHNLVAEANRVYQDDAHAPFPDSPSVVSQLLLFFPPRDLEPYVDEEREHVAVYFKAPFRDSASFRPLDNSVEEFARQHRLDAVLTGRLAQFFRAGDVIARENMCALGVGCVLIGGCFILFFRSVRLTVIGMVPNVLAVLGSLAFLGICGINLDVGTSIQAAIALGLIVDDTGHMLSRFIVHRRGGHSAEMAARLANAELRGAITSTTMAVVIPFAVLNFCEFAPLHAFARLMTVTKLYALFGDVVVLPALLARFGNVALIDVGEPESHVGRSALEPPQAALTR